MQVNSEGLLVAKCQVTQVVLNATYLRRSELGQESFPDLHSLLEEMKKHDIATRHFESDTTPKIFTNLPNSDTGCIRNIVTMLSLLSVTLAVRILPLDTLSIKGERVWLVNLNTLLSMLSLVDVIF